MDLYTLDPITFLINGKIDEFTSLIWTERYNDAGDVTLVVPSNPANKAVYVEGMFLWTPVSKEIALVDTVDDKDGVLTITGEFLVTILKNRLLRDSWSTANTAWKLTGTPGAIAGTIVTEMCTAAGRITSTILPSTYGSYEAIPGLTVAAAPPGTSTTIAVDYGTVFDGVKTVCDTDELGFTLQQSDLGHGSQDLRFIVYAGRDLTSDQSTYEVVAFDPALDSLADTEELRSISGYMTAAYAWAANMTSQAQIGSAFVSGMSTTTGFQRRSMMVDASDVDATKYTSAELTSILNRRAKDALVNNNYIRMTNGQLVPNSEFAYGVDYLLGDIVELRGNSSLASQARITEYIRSQDNTGEIAYPTLSVI